MITNMPIGAGFAVWIMCIFAGFVFGGMAGLSIYKLAVENKPLAGEIIWWVSVISMLIYGVWRYQ